MEQQATATDEQLHRKALDAVRDELPGLVAHAREDEAVMIVDPQSPMLEQSERWALAAQAGSAPQVQTVPLSVAIMATGMIGDGGAALADSIRTRATGVVPVVVLAGHSVGLVMFSARRIPLAPGGDA